VKEGREAKNKNITLLPNQIINHFTPFHIEPRVDSFSWFDFYFFVAFQMFFYVLPWLDLRFSWFFFGFPMICVGATPDFLGFIVFPLIFLGLTSDFLVFEWFSYNLSWLDR
jgi:hypothetical protein